MPGISSVLNLAKTGVLSNQFNLHITGNNINNVNTQGYSRQSTIQMPLLPSMTYAGPVGNGANVEQVIRYYDRFLTATLFDKTSIKSGLDTRMSGMSAIEQNFNEIERNGINELLNEFWTAWDDLAGNAEGIPERSVLLERANLLAKGVKDRYDFLIKMNNDIGVNIKNVINNINKYSMQIAELNVQIISSEAGPHKANDLRDQRDELIKKLSELADIHYFETERGTYTVLIGQGSPLVEGDKYWKVEMRSDKVYWVGSQGALKELSAEDVIDGELGGWLDLQKKIKPADKSLLKGSIINTSRNRPINPETPWEQIDGVTVVGNFTILATGTDQDGLPYRVSFSYIPSQNIGTNVEDFLLAIESAFQLPGPPPVNRVDARISLDGRLVIEDLMPGNFPISFNIESISGGIYGLNFGKLDGSYPLNYTETLNRWAEQFIKYVNDQHSQGIGLLPVSETTSNNRVMNQDQPIGYRASGLRYSDVVENGQFEIWLYDKDGNVIDFDKTTPEVNDPLVIRIQKNTTSLNDIRDAINNAQFISPSGAFSGNLGINARILQGRLVIQVDGSTSVVGFAFGRDSSNALMALGLNPLFLGYDATTIQVNPVIKDDLRLLAAAQVEKKGAEHISSILTVSDSRRPIGIDMKAGNFNIKIYDKNLNMVDNVNIPVQNPDYTTIDDIVKQINEIKGLFAEVVNGKININVLDKEYKTAQGNVVKGAYVSFGNDNSELLRYLGLAESHNRSIPFASRTGLNSVLSNGAILSSQGSGLTGFSMIKAGQPILIRALDTNGTVINSASVNFGSGWSLNDLATALTTGIPFVNASVIGNNLQISPLSSAVFLEIQDSSNIMGALGFDLGVGLKSFNGVLNIDAPLKSFYGQIRDGNFKISIYNENTQGYVDYNININASVTSLNDLKNSIDAIPGVTAYIKPEMIFNGIQNITTYRLVISGLRQDTYITLSNDTSFVLSSLGIGEMKREINGIYNMNKTNEALNKLETPIRDGFFNVYMYDNDGRVLAPQLTGTSRLRIGTTLLPVNGTTQIQSINGVIVSGSFNIIYSGRDQYGKLIRGVFSGTATSSLNSFLLSIEATYGSNSLGVPLVDAYINTSGQLIVSSAVLGMPIAFQIDEIRPYNRQAGDRISGLNFGEFNGFFRVEVDGDYDSLSDIASRLDGLYGVRSWVKDGRIEIEGEHQVARISLADDSSEFLRLFNLNTPKGGNFSPANNLNALAIRDISRIEVTEFNKATFNGYYQQLVSEIGITSRSIQIDYSFYESAVNQLQERRDNISAVSLDEEMANLIRFQHSFTAASKLMKVADEMFVTILETK